MQTIEQAYKEICKLHEQLTQSPAPEIGPQSFVPFPLGVDPISFAMEEVSRLKHIVESSQVNAQSHVMWVPRVSVYASDTSVLLHVEIPGVEKEEVAVTVAGGEMVVRGRRRQPETDGSLKPVMVEQAWGTFERRFPCPPWCNPEKINAKYSHGVLEIRMNRQEEGNVGEFRVEVD